MTNTLTTQPPFMTAEQHAWAEHQGWSFFRNTDAGRSQVQRLDERQDGKALISDSDAITLARLMGFKVTNKGFLRSGAKGEQP